MKTTKPVLATQELEIMKIVWQRGNATVRDVYEELLTRRKIAYTTVMTMMGILEQKGYLTKKESGRAYVYRPTDSERKVLGVMVRDFVKRVFGGSSKPLFVHLLDSGDATAEELEELSKLLKEKRRKK